MGGRSGKPLCDPIGGELIYREQLRNAMMYKDAFDEYQEGPITFA